MQFISLLCFLCYLFEWESVCLYLYKYMQVCVFIGTNDMITTNGRLGLPFPSCWNVAATTAIVVLAIRDMNDDENKVEKIVFYWATKTRWKKIWNMMTSSLASLSSSLLSSVKLISFLSCHKLNLTSMNSGWQQQWWMKIQGANFIPLKLEFLNSKILYNWIIRWKTNKLPDFE